MVSSVTNYSLGNSVTTNFNYNFGSSGSTMPNVFATNPMIARAAFASFWIMLAVVLIAAAYYVLVFWKIFKKAGRPGWAALAPGYNFVLLLEMLGWPGWIYPLLLISLYAVSFIAVIPFIGWAIALIAGITVFVLEVCFMLKLGDVFGKSALFKIFLLCGVFFGGPIGLGLSFVNQILPLVAIGAGFLATTLGLSLIAFGSSEYIDPNGKIDIKKDSTKTPSEDGPVYKIPEFNEATNSTVSETTTPPPFTGTGKTTSPS